MAEFNIDGVSGTLLNFYELFNIPDSVREEMVKAGADAVLPVLKRSVVEKGLVDTGQLLESLTTERKENKKDGSVWYKVFPKGTRKDIKSRRPKELRKELKGKWKVKGEDRSPVYKYKRKKATYKLNSTVGFFTEYGNPIRGIAARRWLGSVIDECQDAATNAEMRVYDHWIETR